MEDQDKKARRCEQSVGRSDPPHFRFQTLRLPIADRLAGPSGLSSKIVSIVAPVGYGKTVLMSLLLSDLRRTGKRCIWYSLDERDTTLDGVVASLRTLIETRSSRLHPTQALFAGAEPLDVRIDALIQQLNRSALPITLFIDNLHHCSDENLGRLLDRLCFETRPGIQLVLTGTRDIPLNAPRARLEGLLRPVGPDELSFDPLTVARLLGDELCERIGADGVARIASQTEGWPAAIRMVQIILSGSDQPRAVLAQFSGTDENLAQLLNRQVLSGFSPEARHFLLTVAPLRSFCADLCRHASGDERAAEVLADLLGRNVFVIPMDRSSGWYRLHGLFRDYLIREAERVLPAPLRRRALQRAAEWCEDAGYWREAVDYALASGSTATTSRILDRIAASFVRDRGDIQQYVRWADALHEQRAESTPEAEFWFVWALAFCRRYEDARLHSSRLIRRLEADGRAEDPLLRRIALLRSSIDCLTDRLVDAHGGASAWLAGRDDGDDPFNLTAAHCIESDYHASHYRFGLARREIEAARSCAFQTGSAYVDGWVSAYAALPPVYEGDYASAYPPLVTALDAAQYRLGEHSGIGGTLAMIAAHCAIEMGLDLEARHLLAASLPTARTHGFMEATGLGLEAAIALWSGADDDVVALPRLREIAAAYPPRLAQMLACQLIRRLIGLGRGAEARDEAERLGLLARGGSTPGTATIECEGQPLLRDLIADTELELLIDGGRASVAEARLVSELATAAASGRQARQVDLLLLRLTLSQSLPATGKRREAVGRCLSQAVRLAAPRRVLRPFLRHGETLAAVIADARPGDFSFAIADDQRFFSDLCTRGGWVLPSRQGAVAGIASAAPMLDVLTPRELELLHLLDAGLSNQQIANHADVSLTTIKWHLQNLYGKLDVPSRSAALARARNLKLLSA